MNDTYLKSKKILIVDDEECLRSMLITILEADDYITKPFMPKELIFRLNAVLRRCYKEDSPLIELRDCKIDLANAQVIWEDKILPLTAKEHDILLDCYRTKLRYSYWVSNR